MSDVAWSRCAICGRQVAPGAPDTVERMGIRWPVHWRCKENA